MITAALFALGARSASAQALVEMCDFPTEAGYIQVNGTTANDTIVLASSPLGDLLVVRFSGGQFDTGMVPAIRAVGSIIVVEGGSGDDCIDTTALAASCLPEIFGGDGDDLIICGPSADSVSAGAGDDVVLGGDGGDILYGGPGAGDCLVGGPGEDSIADEDGVARLDGGDGDDAISVVFSAAWDDGTCARTRGSHRIRGGGGNDYVMITVLGAPLLLTINGDGESVLKGTADMIEITGPLAPGSSTPNFEFVTTVTP